MNLNFQAELDQGNFAEQGKKKKEQKNKAVRLSFELDKSLQKQISILFILLKKMKYINSRLLNVLITLLTKMRNPARELYICQVPKSVQKLIVIRKLNSIYKIEASLI